MSKLTKLAAALGLYWQYSLDTILTHVFVIAYLKAGLSTTAAILMSIDSVFKILFSVVTSRFAVNISPAIRGKVSAVLKFTLVIIWFVAVSLLTMKKLSIIIFAPYLLFKLVILFDSFVSSDFIFGLRKYFYLDITQSAAVQNILMRASTAVAPATALIMLSVSYASLVIFILALILTVFSIYLLRIIFFSPPINSLHTHTKPLMIAELFINKYMRWGFVYQIFANLAFAGVSFILLKELPLHSGIILNDITMLYLSFFITQLIVFIFGEAIVPAKRTSDVAFILGLCGCFVFLASLNNPGALRLVFSLMIGLTYSLTLSAVQKVVVTKLRGSGYIEYLGYSQMAGRLASFTVTMLFGLAMSMGITASTLLMLCGVLGIFSSFLLIAC